MIVELFLFALLIFFIFKLDEKPKDYPPGPWGIPVIGDVFHMDLITPEEMKRLVKKYGKIFSIRVGSRLMVFMSDFELIKNTFSRPEMQGRPDFYSFVFQNCFKDLGITLAEGEIWSHGRRFALRHLRDLGLGKTRIQESVQMEAAELVKYFDNRVGKPTEVDMELNVAILNVVWQLVANKRYAIDDKQLLYFTDAINDRVAFIQGPCALFNVFPWMEKILPSYVVMNWFGARLHKEERDNLFKFLKNIIEEHRKNLNPDDPRDYIDHYLLEMEKEKDNPDMAYKNDYEDLAITIADLFVAGTETTSSSIRWLILLLVTHPEEQKKVHDLIDEFVPKDRLPCLEDRKSLVYMEAVILESMRYGSFVAQGVPHTATKDTTIAGYKIPKGAILTGCHQYIHYNSRYFERPNEFYPGHFIGKKGELLTKKEGFAPFSIGRRQCLGESLAKTDLFLFTAAILQKFKIVQAPGHPLDLKRDPSNTLFLKPRPYKVILECR